MTLYYWHEDMGDESEAEPFTPPGSRFQLEDTASDMDIEWALADVHEDCNYRGDFTDTMEFIVIYPNGRKRKFVSCAEETVSYSAHEVTDAK